MQDTSPSHHNWTLVGFLQLTHINPQSTPSRTTDIYQCQFETAISMNNKYVSTTLMTPSVLIDTVKMLGNGHLALFLGFIKLQFPFFSNMHLRQLLNTIFFFIRAKDRFRNLHHLLGYSTMPTGAWTLPYSNYRKGKLHDYNRDLNHIHIYKDHKNVVKSELSPGLDIRHESSKVLQEYFIWLLFYRFSLLPGNNSFNCFSQRICNVGC